MKRLPVLLLALVMAVLLCGCEKTMDEVRDKAQKKEYTVTEYTQERLENMVYDMAAYRTKGGLVAAFGVKNEQDDTAMVVQFERRSDAEIVCKAIRGNLKDGEAVDLSGCVLVYGNKKLVKELF